MFTIPFYQLINEDSEIWSLVNGFSTLYPQGVENLTPEMIDNINEHFYYRSIAFSSPTKFLRAFHRLVKERAYVWNKLILSEKALSDEEMTRNYDLKEEFEKDSNNQYNSNTESNPNLETITNPNLLNKTVQNTEDKSRLMDTPDGYTSDIENYLSSASKDTTKEEIDEYQLGESRTKQTGTSKTETKDNGNAHEEHTLRRSGNIGTATASDILGGYRSAQMWDCYEAVIFPEVSQLFLSVVEFDEDELY